MYVPLSETADELAAIAQSHGWSLDGVHLHAIASRDVRAEPGDDYTIFHPAEVELDETTRSIVDGVERLQPDRVVFDSLSELRLLARDPLTYRRRIHALKHYFAARRSTVLVLDDRTGDHDALLQLQTIAHGVLLLERIAVEYGGARRRLQVTKLRGVKVREGFHDFTIDRGGLTVFPRVVAAEHRGASARGTLSSGIESLDALLGGGIDRGTSTLLMGPAGTGKSVVAMRYAIAAAERGQQASLFVFDESVETILARAHSLELGLPPHLASGRIHLHPVDPAEMSPGEFANRVRTAAESGAADVLVIDSLNGYLNAMPGERLLIVQLHELLAYLGQRGTASIIVLAQAGLVGRVENPVEVSYLADAVVLLRYFEVAGEVRQAISVLKKRTGPHERTIRELRLGPGVRVGDPVRAFTGVLAGLPLLVGSPARNTVEPRE